MESIMTQTNTQTVATPAKVERPRAWYGVSAREFQALIAAERNPARLAEMRAYASSTAQRRAAKSPRFAAKWQAIADSLSGAPVQVSPKAMATFTSKPVAKRASRKASVKAADPVAAALAAFGGDAHQLLLALATRV